MIRAILVDDEESAIRWLGDVLSSQPGIEVVGTATSVAEALTLMETIRPEVVFLDISMPRQCGMTLFASVDAGIRIVLVTAHDDRARGLRCRRLRLPPQAGDVRPARKDG